MKKMIITFMILCMIAISAFAEEWAILQPGWWDAPSEEIIRVRDQLTEHIQRSGWETLVPENTQLMDNTSIPVTTPTPVPDQQNSINTSDEQYLFQDPDGNYVITAEYTWSGIILESFGAIVKNTSGSTCSFRGKVYFMDDQNQVVGLKDAYTGVAGNNQEVFFEVYEDAPFDHVQYDLKPVATVSKDVQSVVNVSVTKVDDDNSIVQATNHGDRTIRRLRFDLLFMQGEKCLGHASGSFDDELKPGQTGWAESTARRACDNILIYIYE